MKLRLAMGRRLNLKGTVKFVRLLEMPERDFAKLAGEAESDALFRRLLDAGAVTVQPFPHARFAARRFAGRELRAVSGDGLPLSPTEQDDVVRLIERVGQEAFQECLLGDSDMSDEERARRCAISADEAAFLRAFVDRLYIQSEFETVAPDAAPVKVLSAVAGIVVEGGRPVVGFFDREIWKGRYVIDEEKHDRLAAGLLPSQAAHLVSLVRRLEFLNLRKSTLYRVLEALIEEQADYLISRDRDRRKPLTQRALAARLGVSPSVLNRLISNKAVELPWGLEAPIVDLLPSAKAVMRDRLHDVFVAKPELSDNQLRDEAARVCGARLSRRSISQYRRELGLPPARTFGQSGSRASDPFAGAVRPLHLNTCSLGDRPRGIHDPTGIG